VGEHCASLDVESLWQIVPLLVGRARRTA